MEKGHLHFVDAMIAISNKDNRNAIKFHKKMRSAVILIPILIGVCAFIYVLFNRLDKYDKEKFNKRNN